MQAINETIQFLFGGKPASYYLGGFIICGLTMLLSVWLHSKKRDPLSPNTPIKFSWAFLLWDNAKRLVVGLITMYLFFRIFDLSNIIAMVGLGFFISLGLDKAIQWLMDNTNVANFLKTDRENFNKDKKNE